MASSLLAVFAVAGCSQPAVTLDGSSTVFPITAAVQEQFRKENAGVRVIVGRSGTGGGFRRFTKGEIDVCNASRPITETEIAECRQNGIEYVALEIALDGLAVCVHPENKWCDSLSVEQLRAIWQPQSVVAKWNDVNPQWPNEKMNLYGAGTESGTFDYFTEEIVGERQKSRSDYMPSEDDNVLVTGIAGDVYSLGYFGLAYYENNRSKLKLVAIDPGDGKPVLPSLETVQSGTYRPLSRPLFLYIRKSSLAKPEVRAFVQFYLDRVSGLVEKVGYVPIAEEDLATSKKTLREALDAMKPTT
jgi:phosphate transport system substrate-binding protein